MTVWAARLAREMVIRLQEESRADKVSRYQMVSFFIDKYVHYVLGLIVGLKVGVNDGLIVLIWVNEWIRLDTISTENMAYKTK